METLPRIFTVSCVITSGVLLTTLAGFLLFGGLSILLRKIKIGKTAEKKE